MKDASFESTPGPSTSTSHVQRRGNTRVLLLPASADPAQKVW